MKSVWSVSSWNQCEINIFLRSEGNKPYFAVWWVFQNSCWFDMIRTAITSHLAAGKIVKLSEIHIKQMRRSVAERKGLELVVETSHTRRQAPKVYIQLFRERLSEKNVHARIPNGNMEYNQYTVPDDSSCRTYFCCFPLALANICPWPLVLFFQISFEEKLTQNHPQYLSGLSHALFPRTFLEIAVYVV